jgi:hypothetical protein
MAFGIDWMDRSGKHADGLQSVFDLTPVKSEFLAGDIDDSASP